MPNMTENLGIRVESSKLAEQFGLGPHPKALKKSQELAAAGMIVMMGISSNTTTLNAVSPDRKSRIILQFFDD